MLIELEHVFATFLEVLYVPAEMYGMNVTRMCKTKNSSVCAMLSLRTRPSVGAMSHVRASVGECARALLNCNLPLSLGSPVDVLQRQ